MSMDKTRIYIIGVGGQGTLMATALIGQAALLADSNANLSEIHGMAQRGGIVESAVTLGNLKSPMVSEGEADILLGFEPCETIRAAKRCSSKTVVITNSVPLQPFTVSTGKEEYPDIGPSLEKMEKRVKKLMKLDANARAREAGSIVSLNIVMLGALARYGDLPFTADHLRKAIKENTKAKFQDMNLKAFELGYGLAEK
jgi:indolepyruvate ferredoxin oxidoreductase beta subunit